jgi:enoyl-CoA hydratase/carnithine racemase
VVLTGAGDRGLCAGDDIRAIHQDVVSRSSEDRPGPWRRSISGTSGQNR